MYRALGENGLEQLTLVSANKLEATIKYLDGVFNPEKLACWEEFWMYFRKVWIDGTFAFETWNRTALSDAISKQYHRTNCALERYNETLNHECPTPHPNIFAFVELLRTSSMEYL